MQNVRTYIYITKSFRYYVRVSYILTAESFTLSQGNDEQKRNNQNQTSLSHVILLLSKQLCVFESLDYCILCVLEENHQVNLQNLDRITLVNYNASRFKRPANFPCRFSRFSSYGVQRVTCYSALECSLQAMV